MSAPLDVALRAGCQTLGLELDEAQIAKLLDFMGLLQKWNKVYNLTAVRNPEEMLTHHLLDSLAAVAPLRRHLAQQGGAGRRLLDVGSGGGLPGVVIALCCPELSVCCVDTVAKKASFIQHAAGALGLNNLRGVHARVESVEERFDVVTSRAFASLADFVAGSRQALGEQGVWMAMKGKRPDEEMVVLPPFARVFHVEPLTVPSLDAERCLVWMRPATPN